MLTLTCHSAPLGKPPGNMAAFQAGIVVPDEDKSAGKGRTHVQGIRFTYRKKII